MTSRKTEIKSYKDLEIWQEGMGLVTKVYQVTREFPKEELYGLTSQIRRAAISVPANIAEGCARNHRNEFRQFLYVSLASLAELETLMTASKQLGFINGNPCFSELENSMSRLRNRTLALLRGLN